MAEPLSVAASAIQVAGAGLKLANTLKSYIDSVRKAERLLRPIADHVKLASDVLANVGTLLENDEIRSLYTDELLSSTKDALSGCRTAFEDLEKFTSKLLKLNDAGKVSIQTTARFTLYFKQKELDVLQTHMERFKSSLDLVLGVLNLASPIKSAKDSSIIAEMKINIERLIQVEQAARKKEASLVAPSMQQTLYPHLARSLPTDETLVISKVVPGLPAMHAAVISEVVNRGLDSGPGHNSINTDDTIARHAPEDDVVKYLGRCADAAARLTTDIEKAITKWHETHEHQSGCLSSAWYSTMSAMNALSEYEDRSLQTRNLASRYVAQSREAILGEDVRHYRFQQPIISEESHEQIRGRMQQENETEIQRMTGRAEHPRPSLPPRPALDPKEYHYYKRRVRKMDRSRSRRRYIDGAGIPPKKTTSSWGCDDSYESLRRGRIYNESHGDQYHGGTIVEGVVAGWSCTPCHPATFRHALYILPCHRNQRIQAYIQIHNEWF